MSEVDIISELSLLLSFDSLTGNKLGLVRRRKGQIK
jgi:hypothetical protein